MKLRICDSLFNVHVTEYRELTHDISAGKGCWEESVIQDKSEGQEEAACMCIFIPKPT